MQVSYWRVLWADPGELLGVETDGEGLCEMLRKTVFPNHRLQSWTTLLLLTRTLFFLSEKALPWFMASTVLYPYLVVERGQWYRLFTGFMRCEDGMLLLLHVGIYMQLDSYYEIVLGSRRFGLLWAGCVLGAGLFVVLVNVVGSPLLAELGIVLGIFFVCSLFRWQREHE
jgi:hypothetical protein